MSVREKRPGFAPITSDFGYVVMRTVVATMPAARTFASHPATNLDRNATVESRSRFTLAQRLFAMSVALVAALAVVAVTVWVLMTQVADHAGDVKAMRVPQLQRIAEIELNVTRASLQMRHAILARTPAEMNAALADIAEKRAVLEEKLEAFGRAMTNPAGREAFAPLPGLLREFVSVATENVKLIQAGRKDEAFAYLVDKTIPARNSLLTPLNAEKDRQGAVLNEELGSVASEASMARSVVLGIVAFVGLGLLGFAGYVTRVMRQLGDEPERLKAVASAVAAGDLSTRIELRAGDTDSVMAALRSMRDNLARTVQEVRSNADSVAGASGEIASGNADLSGRTEQQASALQQTAASMEELGTTVRQNADNARQANQLAIGSSQVAEQGGEMVREVVETMRGINESSHKIADIIGVIDGIAFQTNILALNAAVEAARAGEQGRGFAVVASEVRTLAQRSADAARQIKSLIEESVGRVGAGATLVDRAGTTMQEIVGSIRRVTDIVGEISSASEEQSRGVAQVGEAVSQMDRVTQQNAALVEQSAAAAESLRQEAQQLVDVVAAFRLQHA
jgi:methyl-accepting chemotaxis protein